MGLRTDIKTQERIEAYLDGKLSKEELQAFEQEMATDPGLARQTELTQLANEAIFDAGLLQLKGKMQSMRSTGKPPVKFPKNLLIGMGGIAIIALSIWSLSNLDISQENAEQAQVKPEQAEVAENKEPQTIQTTTKEQERPKTVVKNNEQKPTIDVTESETDKTEPGQEDKATDKQEEAGQEERSLNTTEASQGSVDKEETPADNKQTTSGQDPPTEQAANRTEETDNNTKSTEAETPADSNICEGVQINAFVDTRPGCENPPSGKLIIDAKTLTGGQAPYSFAIESPSGWQEESSFEHLVPGAYTIYLRDSRGCTSAIHGNYVDRKDCGQAYSERFSPPLETWQVPVAEGRHGELKIYNRANQIVLQTRTGTGYQTHWDGRDMNQRQLPAGLYLFVITYPDGTLKKGQVTIIR